MTFFVGFGAGALFMFVVMFALALAATAKDADDALARYFEEQRFTARQGPAGPGKAWHGKALDLPLPPRDSA